MLQYIKYVNGYDFSITRFLHNVVNKKSQLNALPNCKQSQEINPFCVIIVKWTYSRDIFFGSNFRSLNLILKCDPKTSN